MRETIRVLIADDEAEIRAALADLIASEDSLELVGAARDAGEAVELAGANRPDVALLDVRMPGGGGLRAARGILRRSPETRVLALSAYQDRGTVLQMLGAGAIGYLVKGVAAEEIVVAIERAVRGQTSVSSEVMAGVVRELATRLQRERMGASQVREKTARIRRAIGGAGLSVVYQPIFDLGRRTVVGHEALARFALPPDRPPDDWFAEAGEIALKLDLELVAIRLALPELVRIPDDAYLSLNVSHRTAMSAELIEAIDATPVDRLVVEITEHEQVEDYDALIPALDRLRSRGGRIAIDDAGAGFASLQHTLRLSPDIIKVDISLTHRIDQQRGQRALAAALISFAQAMGMEIVAEGIETEAELDTLLRLGVRYGQGFFLARPAPTPYRAGTRRRPQASPALRRFSFRATMDRIRVLIAEDEAAVREALAELVSSDPDMDVVGTACDADQAIEMARSERPDVALVDVKMPGGGGARAARGIRRESPQTHVVALSAYNDRRTVLEMLRAGVVGYIVKGTSADEILYTIRRSIVGQGSLSVEVTADVIRELASLLERSETLTHEFQELDRTKSELIQILSHELFTPITMIQGFATTVAEYGADLKPEEFRDLAAGVNRASARIKRTVGNLGAAARLDRLGLEVPTQPVPVGELLERAASEFPQYENRIRLPHGGDMARHLWANLDLAVRAVVVVLENALALSPDTEPVDVQVEAKESEVEIAVSDRGPGVPPEEREVIFQAFTQGDGSTTRSHEGLGIGLYLVRLIMGAHGGRVGVISRNGGGSTFVLTFPASP